MLDHHNTTTSDPLVDRFDYLLSGRTKSCGLADLDLDQVVKLSVVQKNIWNLDGWEVVDNYSPYDNTLPRLLYALLVEF